ncbi:MAG TPA: hypothetical protein VFW71_10400 [Actinomycetota bacterium]|nr:hypothetical protein [Actinomycetota bacterium]
MSAEDDCISKGVDDRRRRLVGLFTLLIMLALALPATSAVAAATKPALRVPTRGTGAGTPDPFAVLWTVADPRGGVIAMRVGRDRNTAGAWGDGWENFGLAHVAKGHLGFGKEWADPAVMNYWLRRAITMPSGIYPDLNDTHNDLYILCVELRILGTRIRITTTVVVDMRPYKDFKPLGVKTAFQKVEGF